MLGTDIVTVFKKQPDGSFTRHIVDGVQWSDKYGVTNVNGRVSVSTYVEVTFFNHTYYGLDLPKFSEEDAVFYGIVNDKVVDGKISTLLRTYPRSGVIKSVNDNTNRRFLQNIKVVLA